MIGRHGRPLAAEAVREALEELRSAPRPGDADAAAIADRVSELVRAKLAPTLRRVFNLTGTALHTNLGRAPLPQEAIEAMAEAAAAPAALEYDLERAGRGDRDSHVAGWLRRLTGAEDATVVNNNAAAILLVLNTFARRKEVPVSRGELIEIGGAFRLPEVMARAGCKLREVGTTNRTHLSDYEAAMGARTALVMKVHSSNYAIRGFTAAPTERALAALCRGRGLPFAVDLGSGALVDLARYGLPREPTARDSLDAGADLVTFSGDKLLGGPQAGIVVGRAALIDKIKRNPMKRALRLDKTAIAALSAVLKLYADPDRLAARLPTLRLLTRSVDDIAAQAARLVPPLARRLGAAAAVASAACKSQIGSGALPVESLPSRAIAIAPRGAKRAAGREVERLAAAFAALPIPVIGRIRDNRLWLDLRCLDDEATFVSQLAELDPRRERRP